MSALSQKARNMLHAKARRLAGADPVTKVDASSWTPPPPLNAGAQTGLRPVSPRAFKRGGAAKGEKAASHAGRVARKGVDAKINRNVKAANAELGKPHIGGMKKGGRLARADGGGGGGGNDEAAKAAAAAAYKEIIENGGKRAPAMKKGGRTHKDMGGLIDPRAAANAQMTDAANRAGVSPNRMNFQGVPRPGGIAGIGLKKGGKAANYTGGTRPTGGRIARKAGGRAKGKTNIVIAIGQPGQGQGQGAQPPQPMPPRPVPVAPAPPPQQGIPMPMAPPPGGPPPGMPPPPMAGGMPPGLPPMPRKAGGRTYRSYKDMDAGAGGGLGRLEKTEIEARK